VLSELQKVQIGCISVIRLEIEVREEGKGSVVVRSIDRAKTPWAVYSSKLVICWHLNVYTFSVKLLEHERLLTISMRGSDFYLIGICMIWFDQANRAANRSAPKRHTNDKSNGNRERADYTNNNATSHGTVVAFCNHIRIISSKIMLENDDSFFERNIRPKIQTIYRNLSFLLDI